MQINTRRYNLVTIIIIVCAVILYAQVSPAQTAKSPSSDSIAASLNLDRYTATSGQSPWLVLTIRNLSNTKLYLYGTIFRIHVDKGSVEARKTHVHRSMTGSLLPGEAPIRGDESSIWTIDPLSEDNHKFEVSYFYDINEPGSYAAYIEITDPRSHIKIRTNTVNFTIGNP